MSETTKLKVSFIGKLLMVIGVIAFIIGIIILFVIVSGNISKMFFPHDYGPIAIWMFIGLASLPPFIIGLILWIISKKL